MTATTFANVQSRPRFYPTVKSILVVAFNKSIADEMNVRIRNPRNLPPKTAYQAAICQKTAKRDSHIVVNALAGTGKTTTIEHVVATFPQAAVRAATLHSTGMNALRYHLRQQGINEIDVRDDKVRIILSQLTDYEQLNDAGRQRADLMISPAVRLVSLMKSQGFAAIRDEAEDEDLRELVAKYDVEMPDELETKITETEVFELARRALNENNREVTVIDFDDMIYLPLLLKVTFYRNDLILIDESQDLNPAQIAMVKRMANGSAQCVFVGDRNQAIYGFRGADVEAIESIVDIFNATELPLSTCWRCPVAVIEAAQQIVPAIEAAPNALQGKVETLAGGEDEMVKVAEAGDFVLCRTTAPLVETCMKFIRAGKAATVRGRDIAAGLETLCDKIRKRRTSKGRELIEALSVYREEQMSKLSHPSKESQRQSVADRLDTLLVLSEECDTFDELKSKIRSIFSDAQNGELKGLILCSTAHKAKGLEAPRVFIIKPELMPHPMARQAWQRKQEMNLRYVAITRATRELYWVPKDPKPATTPGETKQAPSGQETTSKTTDCPPLPPIGGSPEAPASPVVPLPTTEVPTIDLFGEQTKERPASRKTGRRVARKGILRTE